VSLTAEQKLRAILEDREASRNQEGWLREEAQRERAQRWREKALGSPAGRAQ
jgi:hypothetical protein